MASFHIITNSVYNLFPFYKLCTQMYMWYLYTYYIQAQRLGDFQIVSFSPLSYMLDCGFII